MPPLLLPLLLRVGEVGSVLDLELAEVDVNMVEDEELRTGAEAAEAREGRGGVAELAEARRCAALISRYSMV